MTDGIRTIGPSSVWAGTVQGDLSAAQIEDVRMVAQFVHRNHRAVITKLRDHIELFATSRGRCDDRLGVHERLRDQHLVTRPSASSLRAAFARTPPISALSHPGLDRASCGCVSSVDYYRRPNRRGERSVPRMHRFRRAKQRGGAVPRSVIGGPTTRTNTVTAESRPPRRRRRSGSGSSSTETRSRCSRPTTTSTGLGSMARPESSCANSRPIRAMRLCYNIFRNSIRTREPPDISTQNYS